MKREVIIKEGLYTLNVEGYIKLLHAACNKWRQILGGRFYPLIYKDSVKVQSSFIEDMVQACDKGQLDVVVEVFGLEYEPEFKKGITMVVGSWYEEESKKCLIQYLGDDKVLGLFRRRPDNKLEVWDWHNDGTDLLKELTPELAVKLLNQHFKQSKDAAEVQLLEEM